MTDREHIDALIATYRDLNLRVRPQSEERLRLRVSGAEASVRDVVTSMRDEELAFSQEIKDTLAGFGAEGHPEGSPVLGTESQDDTTATILAQFGTARESTLAMLRALPAQEWDTRAAGRTSLRDRVNQRVANDRASMERIVALLGSPA